MNPYTRIDYRRLLTSQYPSGYYNVLYGSAGTHVASCVINIIAGNLKYEQFSAHGFFAEAKTFLYQTKDLKEAHYLCALLNSRYVDDAIKPYQTKGAWGERDIQRRPFEVLPIPKFNPQDENHLKLAKLSEECHIQVSQLSLKYKSIGILRNEVRTSLSSELSQIDELVKIALGKITEF